MRLIASQELTSSQPPLLYSWLNFHFIAGLSRNFHAVSSHEALQLAFITASLTAGLNEKLWHLPSPIWFLSPTVDGSGLEFTNLNQWPWAERESRVMHTIQDMISHYPNIEKKNMGKGVGGVKINSFFATVLCPFSLIFHQIGGERCLIYFYLLTPPSPHA